MEFHRSEATILIPQAITPTTGFSLALVTFLVKVYLHKT
jgi:hypothetical protein